MLNHLPKDVCRVLLVFGNPLGNLVGDTVIATQHVSRLRSIARKTNIDVWTGDPDVWEYLCPSVSTVVSADVIPLVNRYDLVIFDSCPVPCKIRTALEENKVTWIHWRTRAESLNVFECGAASQLVKLPPLLNHTQRIGEAYDVLGISPCSKKRSSSLW